MNTINKAKVIAISHKFIKSIWLFPSILTILLVTLTALQIHGSSIGIYHNFFYGESTQDKDLLLNKPQPIRSDEWVVISQKTVGQSNNEFKTNNTNAGNGEDSSLLADTPYRDWSILFKPHNLGFFVLSFDSAFALRWWLMSYFLVISAYFFILMLMPGRRMLATLLSLALLASPFVQWWYIYSTTGSIYWALFGILAFVGLLKAKTLRSSLAWATVFFYVATCFIMVLYPPFQIPCAIVAASFTFGYFIDNRKKLLPKDIKRNTLLLGAATLCSFAAIGIFIYQKHEVVSIVQNTAYPGQRVVSSGGYSKEHLLTSHLSPIFQNSGRAMEYSRPSIGATNQSESSNFLLLIPFLILPALYLIANQWRKKRQIKIAYTALLPVIAGVVFLAWLFAPYIDTLGKLFLLDKVPQGRLLIGVGLLNFILVVLFIKFYSSMKQTIPLVHTLIYTILSTLVLTWINFHVLLQFPGFIGFKSAVLLAIVMPLIVFFILIKRTTIAALFLLAFSLYSVASIHPLYRTTAVLTKTPISTAIQEVDEGDTKRWISEDFNLENFAQMNGKPSLTGVYVYPQLALWDQLNQKEVRSIYNRYAHVNFTFDRDPLVNRKPIISLPGPDQFNVRIEPCDPFFKQNNVGYLITSLKLAHEQMPCGQLVRTVPYPVVTYYIYKLSW